MILEIGRANEGVHPQAFLIVSVLLSPVRLQALSRAQMIGLRGCTVTSACEGPPCHGCFGQM
jgi:hypothetical protein